MTALITLFVVLLLSLVVTRVATVALTLTGMSREAARFQARSAFTGAGFTTSESEMVVSHPVRRRIVMLLMLLGNAGIVAAVGSLLLAFIGAEDSGGWWRLVALVAGVIVLWAAASSRYIDRLISLVTTRALRRWTSLDLSDYAEVLHLGGDYAVGELHVRVDEWPANRTLAELDLRSRGMLTLGVERAGGTFIGVPPLETRLAPGDRMTLYGRRSALTDIGRLASGADD